MQKHKRRICLIQMHYIDLEFSLEKYNPIRILKSANIFDEIVLICPNMEENKIIEPFAQKHGVKLFYGDVHNVTKRMYDAALYYGGEVIVRPSIRWFFLDVALIKNMIIYMDNTGSDYVLLPYDFDERFGAEVFSIHCLERLNDIFLNDAVIKNRYQFAPSGFLEVEENNLTVGYFNDIPTYDQRTFDNLAVLMKEAWPKEGKGQNYADRPVNSYEFAKKYLGTNDHVLDIACGTGYGTNLLTTGVNVVCTGVDISEELIVGARGRFSSNPNAHFICKSFEELDFEDNSFDKIVSLHTMEHIPDDDYFLRKMYDLLKLKGRLLLEIPILRRRPFEGIATPINPDHFREYMIEELKDKVSRYFSIERVFGVNHGFYTDENKMRNACFMVASK